MVYPVLAVRHKIIQTLIKLTTKKITLGRHCCLWCTIPSSQLKVPLQQRGRFPARSLETLKSDYADFVSTGYDPKQAKECNNVIGEYIFDIPLENVQLILGNPTVQYQVTQTNTNANRSAYLDSTFLWGFSIDCGHC